MENSAQAPNPLTAAARPEFVAGDGPRENLFLGLVGGLFAALVAAALWGALAALTHFKIGYAAVGVGFLVGVSVRGAGNGHSPKFGYVGAVLALFGCIAGDLLSDVVMSIGGTGVSYWQVALGFLVRPGLAFAILKAGFGPLDALFYFFALSAGYRNAFHR